MLPVDSPTTLIVLWVVLLALVVMLFHRAVRKDRRVYQRFKRYRSTARRQGMYRKWFVESFCWLGGSAAVLLALAWQFIPLMLDRVEGWPVMHSFRSFVGGSGGLIPGFAVGAAIVVVASVVLPIFLVRPGPLRSAQEVPTVGDVHALLPRNRVELRYGWALSINAGVVEELLFRLALPVVIFAVSDDALIAVAASVVVFGVLHVYQGVWGVVGTLVVGALLMALFLATGDILWPIIAHALFDLRSLVLIPMVVFKVHKQDG